MSVAMAPGCRTPTAMPRGRKRAASAAAATLAATLLILYPSMLASDGPAAVRVMDAIWEEMRRSLASGVRQGSAARTALEKRG